MPKIKTTIRQNHLSPKDFGMAESRADGSVWRQDR